MPPKAATPPRRRRTRPDMAESAALLRTAIDSAGDAFVAMDGSGIVVVWNRNAEELFGHTVEAAVGKGLAELVFPDRSDTRQLLAGNESTGQWRCRSRLRRRNGEEFDAELQVATTTIDDERMTTLLIRGISMLGARTIPLAFFRQETEARVWISNLRFSSASRPRP